MLGDPPLPIHLARLELTRYQTGITAQLPAIPEPMWIVDRRRQRLRQPRAHPRYRPQQLNLTIRCPNLIQPGVHLLHPPLHLFQRLQLQAQLAPPQILHPHPSQRPGQRRQV